MNNVLKEIVSYKKDEIKNIQIPDDKKLIKRGFKDKIRGKENLSLIAEIKRKSPSDKEIFKGAEFDLVKIVEQFAISDVDCISVLTDEYFFGGSMDFLPLVKTACDLPILAKDFFISTDQIQKAHNLGADCILLICRILEKDQLKLLYDFARSLSLDVLVEVNNQEDIEKAHYIGADLIGINNRDLDTFEIDLMTSLRLYKQIKNAVMVSMSGISESNVVLLKDNFDSVLIGTSIMKSGFLSDKIQKIKNPKPILKICGIREVEDFDYADQLGVDLCGLNFVPSSKRKVDLEKARKMQANFTKKVGVFQNQDLDFVLDMVSKCNLDFVQLHGDEDLDYISKINYPIIKAISSDHKAKIVYYQDYVDMFIFDGVNAGSGEIFDHSVLGELQVDKSFLIAGGITIFNAKDILSKTGANGLDLASGAEEGSKISQKNIKKLTELLKM